MAHREDLADGDKDIGSTLKVGGKATAVAPVIAEGARTGLRAHAMRSIDRIIVHCSDSSFGDAALIEGWHTARKQGIKNGKGAWVTPPEPWATSPEGKNVGYHRVILNGKRTLVTFDKDLDGRVEEGRALEHAGCHTKGQNQFSVAICLIGKGFYTMAQVATLVREIEALRKRFGIPVSKVFGHNDFANKACPGFDITALRQLLGS